MTPTTGPYGTAIAIAGTGFEAKTTAEFAGSPWTDSITAGSGAADGSSLTTRYPFPATGAVTVQTDGGTAQAGMFAPVSSWTPGTGIDAYTPIRARAIGGSVAVLGQTATLAPALAVYGGSAAGLYMLDDALTGDVVADDGGQPEVLATTAAGAFVAITLAGGQASEAQTGITGARFVAAARDAPASTRGSRPGDDLPEPCDELHATAYGSAGSGYPSDEDADHPLAFDEIDSAQLALAASGTRVLLTANVVYKGQPTVETRERGSDGTWTDSSCGAELCAYTGDQLAELATTDDGGLQLVSDVDAGAPPQDLGMWPAQPEALVFDGSGAARPLVAVGDTIWAPTLAP